jgi:galactose mutarotase-like enzyme
MHTRTDHYAGLRSVVLSAGGLTAVVLPDVGAKIVSLVSERTGREFVWRDPTRPLGLIAPGSSYADNDASGIDDCFPTVDACKYPLTPFAGLALGDHGDLWSRGWDTDLVGDEAVFTVAGATLPFTFEKRMRIDEAAHSLVVENTMSLSGPGPLQYQWTGHPLLRVEPGTRITLPPGTASRTAFSTGGRLSVNDDFWSWPNAPSADGAVRDVSLVGRRDDGLNEKYWLTAPKQGCVLEFPDSDEQLHVRVEPAVLPYLGICVNYGGWPDHHPGFWVAVEPSTSPYDSLGQTVQAGLGREIGPGQTHLWSWSLRVTRQ